MFRLALLTATLMAFQLVLVEERFRNSVGVIERLHAQQPAPIPPE